MQTNMRVRILDCISYLRFPLLKTISAHAYNHFFVLLCVTNKFYCFIFLKGVHV